MRAEEKATMGYARNALGKGESKGCNYYFECCLKSRLSNLLSRNILLGTTATAKPAVLDQ